MTLEEQLVLITERIGADIKALKLVDGDLTALPTTNKSNIVAALVEMYNKFNAPQAPAGAQIDDTAVAGAAGKLVVWSADKVSTMLTTAEGQIKLAVKNEILDGAGAALDTLKELGAALNNDPTFAATMATALGYRVRFDEAQVLTVAQKKQACENLGIGDPDVDLVAVYNAAKA